MSTMIFGTEGDPVRLTHLAPASVEPVRPADITAKPYLSGEVAAPISGLQFPVSQPAAVREGPALPHAGWALEEFHCRRGEMQTRWNIVWAERPVGIALPRLSVKHVAERREEAPLPKQAPRKPHFAGVFTMPGAALRSRHPVAQYAGAAVAAAALVVLDLWIGGSFGRLGERSLATSAATAVAAQAGRSGAPYVAGARPASGPLAWAKQKLAKRAAVEMTDSFEGGMAAWGAKSKGWAPGWSRTPEGYVHPGQLALFQPSHDYADYRMEFLGQIESQGIGWVVRARDTQNYLAMKFNVIEPGLRPVISIVHYPVRGGRRGEKDETPLSVMVHNNTPYHVEVVAKGKRFTVSFDGQEVASWDDDAPPSGGVGFFSDPGEHARLYWMKVYANNDWLGRVCGILAGHSRETGGLARLVRELSPVPAIWPLPLPEHSAVWGGRTGEQTRGPARAGASPGRGNGWGPS